MTGVRNKAAIAVSGFVLATGAVTALAPPAHDDGRTHAGRQNQQQVQDLSDAHERELQRMRRDGVAHGEAEIQRRLVPGEYRPRLPLRLP